MNLKLLFSLILALGLTPLVTAQQVADGIAGNALRCEGTDQHALVSGLNYYMNEMTFTAWVKPEGIQSDYTGIVMSDGSALGMNFRGGNNTLGYHWAYIGSPSWDFDSGLIVEPDEWSHVAFVVEPSGVTLYVNGIGVKHEITVYEMPLYNYRMGSYQGWENRNLLGEIDEVCFFRKALTADQIRETMHLTKVPAELTDLKLKNYYQFNNESGNITDRAGVNTATPQGNAQRVVSTGPFGGGTSVRLRVDGSGLYDFAGTGMQLIFDENATTFPDGDMIVNKINVMPNELPAEEALPNPCYWIINNYGENETFDEIEALVINDQEITGTWANVSQYKLFKRGERMFGDTWGDEVDYANIKLLESLIFNDGNNLTSAGQLVLIKGQPLVGLNPLENIEEVSVYPNPTHAGTVLNLEVKEVANKQVNLYDQMGRLAHTTTINTDKTIMLPAHLAAGTYFYMIYDTVLEGYGKVVIK